MAFSSIKSYTSSVNLEPTSMKKLSPSELIFEIMKYENARTVTRDDRLRFIRNLRQTCSLDYDAWKDRDAADMLNEGRDPKSYNLAQKYVRGIAGNYIANSTMPKFIDREGLNDKEQSTIYKLNRAYYADKMHFDYNSSKNQCIENGLIGGGLEELTLVRLEDDPRLRIKFEPCYFPRVMFDVDPYSDRITRDAKGAWKEHYMTAGDMISYFPWVAGKVRDKLEALKQGEEKQPNQQEQTTIGHFAQDHPMMGTKYKVVEYYHFEREKKQVVKFHTQNPNEPFLELPDTDYDIGTNEDFMQKQIWAASKGYQLDPSRMHIHETERMVMYCTTFAPELTILLDNRKDKRQLNGHLPFYGWAYMMKSGKFIGVVDFTYHAQDDINKRAAHITKIITQSPISGKVVVHPLAFGDDINAMDQAMSDMNDASKPMLLDKDCPPTLVGELVHIIQGAQLNPALFQDESFKIQLLDSLANFMPALQGQHGKSGESSMLYGRKIVEGLMGHRVPMEALAQHDKDKAEDWQLAAVKYYGGENDDEKRHNYNRKFNAPDGENVELNAYKGDDENGNPIVENDLSELGLVDTIITQSKENDFQKQAKMEGNTALLNSIRPSEDNNLVIAAIYNDIMHANTYEDEEQKKKICTAADMSLELAIKKAEIMKLNLDKQLEMLQSGKPPAGGGKDAPKISIGFKDLPPEGQVQAAEKAGIHLQQGQPQQGQEGQPPNPLHGSSTQEQGNQMLQRMGQPPLRNQQGAQEQGLPALNGA